MIDNKIGDRMINNNLMEIFNSAGRELADNGWINNSWISKGLVKDNIPIGDVFIGITDLIDNNICRSRIFNNLNGGLNQWYCMAA